MTAPAGTQGHLVSASLPLSAASQCLPQVLHLAELWLRAGSRFVRHQDALGGKQASCFPLLSYSYQIPCEPGRGRSPPSLPFAKPPLDWFCWCCQLPLPAPRLVDILLKNKSEIPSVANQGCAVSQDQGRAVAGAARHQPAASP